MVASAVDAAIGTQFALSVAGTTGSDLVEREVKGRTKVSDQSSGQETTMIDNEVYNVISALHTKLEGLAAYDKYERDGSANTQIWRQLRQQDQQAARQLLQQLNQFAQQGKLNV